MTSINNNGNVLINGSDLTEEQKGMLKFKGMKNPDFVRCNSFWFKDGKPSMDYKYYYPVCKSLEYLPY